MLIAISLPNTIDLLNTFKALILFLYIQMIKYTWRKKLREMSMSYERLVGSSLVLPRQKEGGPGTLVSSAGSHWRALFTYWISAKV